MIATGEYLLSSGEDDGLGADLWIARMKPDTAHPGRFQFTVARLLACTTLVAFAAWVATLDEFISIKTEAAGDVNLFPILAAGLLLAAAIGVLIRGKPGAAQGARAGAIILILAIFMVLPVFVALRSLFELLLGR